MKKAEEFLIAAYWNLLKYKSEDSEKSGANADDSLVTPRELE